MATLEIMPRVTDWDKPAGLPMAKHGSPTRTSSEFPNLATVRGMAFSGRSESRKRNGKIRHWVSSKQVGHDFFSVVKPAGDAWLARYVMIGYHQTGFVDDHSATRGSGLHHPSAGTFFGNDGDSNDCLIDRINRGIRAREDRLFRILPLRKG